MKYKCKIISAIEDEVTVQIGDVVITGFTNRGCEKKSGQEAIVDVQLFDDIEISPCNDNKLDIERKAQTYEYSIYGILDVGNKLLRSVIDFNIDPEDLYNYGYFDGKHVRVDVIRIDLVFE